MPGERAWYWDFLLFLYIYPAMTFNFKKSLGFFTSFSVPDKFKKGFVRTFHSLDFFLKRRAASHHTIHLIGSYRRLLYGGASILTVVISIAAAVCIYAFVQDYLNDQDNIFFAQKDAVSAAVERVESRLRGFTMFHQAIWKLLEPHEKDKSIPLEKYQRLLRENKGITIAEEDLAVEKFSILSTLTRDEDAHKLANSLEILREISPAPKLHVTERGSALAGFIYDSSRRFLGVYPAGNFAEASQRNRSSDLQSFILRQTDPIEHELSKYPLEDLKNGKIVWVPLHFDAFLGTAVASFVGAVFHGDKRVAIIVFNIRPEDFPQFFLNNAREMPNFFVLSRHHPYFLGLKRQSVDVWHFAEVVLHNSRLLNATGVQPERIQKGGMLFFTQRILSPDWIAIYALDWHTIFNGLKRPITLTLLFMVLTLTILWVFVFIFERYVFSPIQIRSRRVHESEQFNRAMILTAPVGLGVIDPQTREPVIKNDIAARLLEGHPERVDAHYKELLALYRCKLEEKLQGRPSHPDDQPDVLHGEMQMITANGRKRDISVSFTQSRYQGRDVVLYGLSDISARKEAERLLLDAKRAADHANQAKSIFLASMGHEIRTPLHGALGNLELLAREPMPPAQNELVKTIRRSFEALLTLLNDILDLSKVEAGELKLEASRINVISVIESCSRTFAPLILKKGVHFFCLIDSRLRTQLIGDGTRIQQILMNLLSNAAKFTDIGKITLRADVIENDEGSYSVRFQVADSGMGISRLNQKKLFSPFTQTDSTITRRFGGTGLGLYLCKRLSKLMGGNVSLISELGFGSVFTFEVPFKIPVGLEKEVPPERFLEGQHVLLVCSVTLWRDSLLGWFERWGASVKAVPQLNDTVSVNSPQKPILVVAHSDTHNILSDYLSMIGHFQGPIVISPSGPYLPESRPIIEAQDAKEALDPSVGAIPPYAIHISSLSINGLRQAFLAAMESNENQASLLSPVASNSLPGVVEVVRHPQIILVAEDDPVNRKLLGRQLNALGYFNIEEAADGKEAFDKCALKSYDALLTDLGMPNMDGFDLIHALKKAENAMPVIVITASTISHEGVDISNTSISSVLHKPASIAHLGRALDKIFSQTQAMAKTVAITPASPVVSEAPSSTSSTSSSSPNVFTIVDPELKKIFIDCWMVDSQAMQKAFTAGDDNALVRQLHKLKGALMVLEEAELALLCSDMQEICRTQGCAAMSALYERFEEDMAQLIQRYQEDIEGN